MHQHRTHNLFHHICFPVTIRGCGAHYTSEFADVYKYNGAGLFNKVRNPDQAGRFRVLKHNVYAWPEIKYDGTNYEYDVGASNVVTDSFYLDLNGISMDYGSNANTVYPFAKNVVYICWFGMDETDISYYDTIPLCYCNSEFYYVENK